MAEETPLDLAHAAMEADPGDDRLRLRFFERLADAELFLLLEAEPVGDQVSPRLFPTEAGDVVLAFDRAERLVEFTGATSEQAILSGRVLADMLAGQGLGLGLNLGVAPSEMLLPAEAVAWLANLLSDAPDTHDARPVSFEAPGGVPEALLTALDAKLPAAAGLATAAYLAATQYDDGTRGHILAFLNATPGAEDALARAAREALVFSGLEAGEMDVAFLASSDPSAAKIARVALRFDLPERERPSLPVAPGSDPEKPPRLR